MTKEKELKDIRLFCDECENELEKEVEMIGEDRCYVNVEVETQSRNYACPICKSGVTVILSFKEKK